MPRGLSSWATRWRPMRNPQRATEWFDRRCCRHGIVAPITTWRGRPGHNQRGRACRPAASPSGEAARTQRHAQSTPLTAGIDVRTRFLRETAYINSVGLTFEDNKAVNCVVQGFRLGGSGEFVVQRNGCSGSVGGPDDMRGVRVSSDMTDPIADNTSVGAGIGFQLGTASPASILRNHCQVPANGIHIMSGTADRLIRGSDVTSCRYRLGLTGSAAQADAFRRGNLNGNILRGRYEPVKI